MTVIYRQAILADLPSLASLFDGYRVYYRQTSDLVLASEFVLARLKNKDSTIFVAQNEQTELLGFVQLYPIFSSVNARSSLLLNDLFVSEKARKLGIGRGLMNKATEYGKSIGVCWIMLQTEKTNSGAQSLYESLGYQRDNDCYYYYLN